MTNQVWTIGMTIDDAEKNIITSALRFFGGNKTMTAKNLGVSIRGLDNKMSRYGISKAMVLVNEEDEVGDDK